MPYIDGLPPATTVNATDLLVVAQGGTAGVPGTAAAKRATVSQVLPVAVATSTLITPAGASTASTLAVIAAENGLRPENFGAAGDGATDDTAALTAWLATLGPGVPGALSAKTYLFSSPLVIANPAGISITGIGPYQSVLVYTGPSTTADLITLGNASVGSANVHLSNFQVSSRTTMTAGTGLRLNKIVRSALENITIDGQDGTGNLWNGVWFNGVDDVLYRGFNIRAQNDGLDVNGIASGPQADLALLQGKITGCAVGLRCGGGFGGLYVDQTNIISNGSNLIVDTSLCAVANRELFFGSQAIFDTATLGANIQILDTLAGTGAWCQFIGSWIATGPTDGLYIGASVSMAVQIIGGSIFNFTRDGIRSNTTSGLYIVGTKIRNNGGWGINCIVADVNAMFDLVKFASNALGNYTGCLPYVLQQSAATVTATGNTQATALLLTTQIAQVGVPSSGAGVILPAVGTDPIGMAVTIYNSSVTYPLLVYPETGSQIANTSPNTPYSLATSSTVIMTRVASNVWAPK